MCLIGNKQHSRTMGSCCYLFCQSWPLFCLHFTSSWNKKPVTEQIYSFSLYLTLQDQNGVVSTCQIIKSKEEAERYQIWAVSLLRVLQYRAEPFRRELRPKKRYLTQMHSRTGAFIPQEEGICHQDQHLLCPLSRRISNHRYLPDKDTHLVTGLLLSQRWKSTEKGCQMLGHFHLKRLRHWVPYLPQHLMARSALAIPNSFPRHQGERLETLVEEDEVREYINEQDLHKSMSPGEVCNVPPVNSPSVNSEIHLLFLNSEVHPQKAIKFCFLVSNI